jgi:hypothetical protein
LCFDAEGNAWIAEFSNKSGKGRVVVVSPAGTLLRELKPEAKLVTNVAFGGESNDEVFVSTGGPSGVFHAKAGVTGFRGHPVPELKIVRTLGVKPLNEPLSTAPDRPRYAELRICHPVPGKVEAVLDRFRAGAWALQHKHGLNPQACWTSLDKSNAVIVQVLAPPGEAAAREAWANFTADPAFGSLEAERESKHGQTFERVETVRLLGPANAWKLSSNRQRPSRVFDLRLYTRAPAKEETFRDRWRDHAIRIYQRHGMDNLGWWEATDPEHPGVMALS